MLFGRFDKRLFTILSIVFVQMAGAAMILPILPLFAERQFQMTPATVTLLVSSYFAAQFLAGPFIGRMSDRYGRVPLLVISQLGSALSFIVMAAAGSAMMLFVARVIDGITGGNIIVAQAYVTDVTPKEKRTESLGYIMAIFGIGFIIGPALGGLLSAWLGPRIPFVIAGAAAVVTAVMSWLLLDETVDRAAAAQQQRKHGLAALNPKLVAQNTPLVFVMIVAFVGQFGFGMLQSTFALFGDAVIFKGYSDNIVNLGVGLLLAAVGLGQFITQVRLIRPLQHRLGDSRLVILGTSVRGLAMALFAIAINPWLGAVASVVFAVGMGLMMPPLQSLATRTVDESMRGAVLGFYQSSVSLAIIFSTAIAGVIFSIQPTLPYWIGALLSAVVIIPGLQLYRLASQGDLRQAAAPAPSD